LIRSTQVVQEFGDLARVADFAGQIQALSIDRARRLLAILQVLQEPEMAQRPSQTVAVVDLAEDRDTLVEERTRFGIPRFDE